MDRIIATRRDRQQAPPAPSAPPTFPRSHAAEPKVPALTTEQATALVRQHGKAVVPRAEWDELCATAAAGIAAEAALDGDYRALFS